MIKRICDMCGAQVEHGLIYNGGYSHKSGTFKIKIWEDGIVKMDICDRCANKIREICQAEKKGGKNDKKNM